MEYLFEEAELPLWVAEGAREVAFELVGGTTMDDVGVILGVTEILGVGMIDVLIFAGTEEESGRIEGNVSVLDMAVSVGLPSCGNVSVILLS